LLVCSGLQSDASYEEAARRMCSARRTKDDRIDYYTIAETQER